MSDKWVETFRNKIRFFGLLETLHPFPQTMLMFPFHRQQQLHKTEFGGGGGGGGGGIRINDK